ncbi:MAG: MerR family transcriptional regulator [Ktedonobacteraceae bacterium]
MGYTVKQLARLAGVTVRTLHYYDEIGLLKPSFIQDNGYRCYEEKELLKLQQILFFRELEFPLEDIVQILDTPGYSALAALADQRHLLEMKRARFDGLLATIDETMKTLREGGKMSTDDLFASFADSQIEQYKEEAKARWGTTDAYKQSMERVRQLTKKELDQIQEEGQAITLALSKLMAQGIANAEVQQQIERHFQHINRFYDCSYEMYSNLGNMYVEDTRFAENYNKFAPHLAEFMRDAIAHYCNAHTKQ